MTNFNELIFLNEDWKALIETTKLVGGFFPLVTSSKSNDQLLSFFFSDGDTSDKINLFVWSISKFKTWKDMDTFQ